MVWLYDEVMVNLTIRKWEVTKLITLSGHLHYRSSPDHGCCWRGSVKVQRESSMTSSVWSWTGVQSPPHIRTGRAGLQTAPAAQAPQRWSKAPTSPGGSWDAWRHPRRFQKSVWIWGCTCSSKAWSSPENAPLWRSDQTWKEICTLLIQLLSLAAFVLWQSYSGRQLCKQTNNKYVLISPVEIPKLRTCWWRLRTEV